ncbi:MAG TPA: NAD(+) diphosphatase [Polyangiales bacterium]|nr:NAD(+) diphosphatase [Polyangiales bacterium]
MPPEPFFSGRGLDRADALRGDAEALAALARDPAARQLLWRDGLPAIGADGRLQWSELRAPELLLGLDDGVPCFSHIPDAVEGSRAAYQVLGTLAGEDEPIFAAALSLGGWHRRHPHCAQCGAATGIARGGWSRRCASCSVEHFPRVDPVVIMLAEHAGRVLLGRQPAYPPGRYSALAGFVEPGETIEAAVARELYEEAGIAVANVRYVASQPWPFPSSLMIGCHADASGAELTVDRNELEDARWFSRLEVERALAGGDGASFQAPPRFAIARTLLERWLGGA